VKVMRVAKLQVGEIEMEYAEAGRGGQVFVLVHGFTGSRDDWREQLPRLAELGRTLALDQRGHGGSTNTGDPSSYGLERMTADLLGFLDALEIERCDLLGHSLGGMVVLRFALAHPERLRSLVLMDTTPRELQLPQKMVERSARLAREQGTGALGAAMRAAASQGRGMHGPASLRLMDEMGFDVYWDRVQAKLDAMDPAAFAALDGGRGSVVDRLGEIGCPTLVMVGEQDLPFLEPSDELEKGIPGARRVTIPEAAHSPQLENPEAWLSAVREHLEAARG
jgi:pimeloyl-ACP methyl ester carboxylesterase